MNHRMTPVLLLALGLILWPAARVHANPRLVLGGPLPAGATVASVVQDGLRLTLKVPRHTYPRNALVQVTLTLTNITSQSIDLGAQDNGNGFCTTSLPQAEVHTTRGALLFPPAVKPLIFPPCPYYLGRPLAAGQSLVNRVYVILRGRVLTGIASTRTGQSFSPFSTPPLTLTLTREPPPTAAVTTSPLGIEVRSPVPVAGKLRYTASWICPNGTSMTIGQPWTVLSGTHINPPCPSPTRWNLAVGWPNHPVTVWHYSAGH